jgi:arginine repressor
VQLYKNTCGCIFVFEEPVSAGKTFRHGQILRLVSDGSIANQEDLRRRLAAQRLRVTQATLSRDIQELRLIKTQRGYKAASSVSEDQSPQPPLARALG